MRFDHAVLVVNDLEAASRDFAELGFTVTPGGEHAETPTGNCLIGLADGAYLELIAFRQPLAPPGLFAGDPRALAGEPSPVRRMVARWEACGEGIAHFAVCPDHVESSIARGRAAGLVLSGPNAGARLRPDGQRVAWQTAIPDSLGVPFYCADVTERALRVPGGTAARHANGAVGVQQVVVAVVDLQRASDAYRAVTGFAPGPERQADELGARCVDVDLPDCRLTLACPAASQSPLRRALSRRGEGPYLLKLRASSRSTPGPLDVRLAHSALLELV